MDLAEELLLRDFSHSRDSDDHIYSIRDDSIVRVREASELSCTPVCALLKTP